MSTLPPDSTTSHDAPAAAGWSMFDQAKRIIPFGTGTHTKAASLRDAEPAYIQRGKGCRLWDVDGKEYIDFRNGLGPVTLGYAYDPVNQAVARQLQDGVVFSHPHPLEYEVASALVAAIPAAQAVRYLKTGGEAMAAAVKFARAYSGNDLLISSGYHGWLLTHHGQKGVPQAVTDQHLRFDYGDLDTLRGLLEAHKGKVAAVSLAGSYPLMRQDDPFPRQLRELTHAHGVLLIIDEIVTGFRLAVGGFHAYYGFEPDLAVFSKGMANGMPISVVVGRREVMAVAEQGAVVSSTFSGETLSLAAAKATLGIYQREPVIDHLWTMGRRLGDGLRKVFKDRGVPISVEGLAPCQFLMGQAGDAQADTRLWQALLRGCYLHGVSMYLVPYVNYSHSADDIDEALRRIDAVCTNLSAYDRAPAPSPGSAPTSDSAPGSAIGVAAFAPRSRR